MKAVSEIVGRGKLEGGRATEVYRALRSLLCATCGAEIADGALFTRRRVKGIGLRIMPQCRKCAPFTLGPEDRKQSELLRALLAEPQPAPQTHNAPEKSLSEEVASRLGPALKRSRKRGRQ